MVKLGYVICHSHSNIFPGTAEVQMPLFTFFCNKEGWESYNFLL